MSILSETPETYEPELIQVKYEDEIKIIPEHGTGHMRMSELLSIKNYSCPKGFSKIPDILERVTRKNFGRFMNVVSFYPTEIGYYIVSGFKNERNIAYKLNTRIC